MLWSLHGSPIKVEYLSKALLTLTDKTKQKHNQPLPLHFSMLMISTWPRRTVAVSSANGANLLVVGSWWLPTNC